MTNEAHDDSPSSKPAVLGCNEGLGPVPEREAWVRDWFAEHYRAGDVFYDGDEALTLAAAVLLVADAQAAERERIAGLARSRPGWFASFADCDDFAECVLRGPNSDCTDHSHLSGNTEA